MSNTKSKDLSQQSIGELVAEDYRIGSVFEKHGIDFCCGGESRLAAVCEEQGLDLRTVEKEIAAVKSSPADGSQDYARWDLSSLADHIVDKHHAYLYENLDRIDGYLQKSAAVHGEKHPELYEISATFSDLVAEINAHLKEEEVALFPALKRLEKASGQAGEALHKIRHLSQGFAIPDDACNTYRVSYQALKEFEKRSAQAHSS